MVVLWDILVSSYSDDVLGFLGLVASAISCLVSVIIFGINSSVGLNILKIDEIIS